MASTNSSPLPRLGLFPEVAKFESSNLSASDIESFYKLPPDDFVPSDRPYTWSNSVATIDGVTSFPMPPPPQGDGSPSSPLIALSGLSPDSFTDWTLLNAGWAYADAVLTTGEILRHEPNTTYVPYQEMLDFRSKTLRKSGLPVNVVITASGKVSPSHPIIKSAEIETLVFTSSNGWATISSQLKDAHGYSHTAHRKADDDYEIFSYDMLNTAVLVLPSNANEQGRLDFHKIFRILRKEHNIRFVDVTAGSVVLGTLIAEKLLDEYRLTQSGAFLGHSSLRSSMPKFPKPFDYPHLPLLRFESIRVGANFQHIFIRSSVDYTHLSSEDEK
jgi:riboflavin biosynthesis pyrimidine reductase